jgi:imidazoleglycerol-phosphate dehydratase
MIGFMKHRTAKLARKTRETDISIALDLDGEGKASIRTGIGFMDHMLELLAKHALIDLTIRAKGDLKVDDHHTVEDLGLALGDALNQALSDRKGIVRYGWCLLPMDDSLATAALDLGGRPFLVYETIHKKKIKTFDVELIEEFFRAFCTQARLNLHLAQKYGKDPHHGFEAMFKAVARALRMAIVRDPRVKGVPSSKGRI